NSFFKISILTISSLPIDIDVIFDIDKESDIEISDYELDETIDRIMDATDEWIKNLKKAGLSYVCSIARRDPNKKSQFTQKESKKYGCKSYIQAALPINSNTVTLQHYYKHNNHQPGQLSDLCTLPLSNNIQYFIKQCALEGLDTYSIQRLLRHRGIELQNYVQLVKKVHNNNDPSNIQSLQDSLVTKDDIYAIVHNIMKTYAYLDDNELRSLVK
ncbi:4730_t:CDS:2, partial [Scutellospora calospora]